LAPLRAYPQFRLLWSSRTVTLLGTEVSQVALLVQVRQLTGSAVLTGLLGAVELVPLVACTAGCLPTASTGGCWRCGRRSAWRSRPRLN